MGEMKKRSLWFSLDFAAPLLIRSEPTERTARAPSDPALSLQSPVQPQDPQDNEHYQAGWRQELLAREEQARLEVIKQAEIARMRVQMDARSELEMKEQRHAHEVKLAQLSHLAHARTARHWIVLGFGLACLFLGGSLTIYFAKLRPENARLQQAYEQLADAERDRADRTEHLLGQARRQNDELRRRVEQLERGQ